MDSTSFTDKNVSLCGSAGRPHFAERGRALAESRRNEKKGDKAKDAGIFNDSTFIGNAVVPPWRKLMLTSIKYREIHATRSTV